MLPWFRRFPTDQRSETLAVAGGSGLNESNQPNAQLLNLHLGLLQPFRPTFASLIYWWNSVESGHSAEHDGDRCCRLEVEDCDLSCECSARDSNGINPIFRNSM